MGWEPRGESRIFSKIPALIRLEGCSLAISNFTGPDFDHTDFMTTGMRNTFGRNDHGHGAITQYKFRKTMRGYQRPDDGMRAFHTVLLHRGRGHTACELSSHDIKIGEAGDSWMTLHKCS